MARSWVAIRAKTMRIAVAAMMPMTIALRRNSVREAGGGEADDDGIVPGEDEVDHDDLEERTTRRLLPS